MAFSSYYRRGVVTSVLPCSHVVSRKYHRDTALHTGIAPQVRMPDGGFRTLSLRVKTPKTPYLRVLGYVREPQES